MDMPNCSWDAQRRSSDAQKSSLGTHNCSLDLLPDELIPTFLVGEQENLNMVVSEVVPLLVVDSRL